MDPILMVGIGLILVVFMVTFSMALCLFKKCPPNQAMIVFGGRGRRVIQAGGTVVLPLTEQCCFISLEAFLLDIKGESPMFTKDGLAVLISAKALIKVKGDEESIMTASEHFQGKSQQEISSLAAAVVCGSLCHVVTSFTAKEIAQGFDMVAAETEAKAAPDLIKMGLGIVSLKIEKAIVKAGTNTGSIQQRVHEDESGSGRSI